DPSALVDELAELGVRLMVSVWPGVNAQSTSYPELAEQGWLMQPERGLPIGSRFFDVGQQGQSHLHFVDPSNPEARRYLWSRIEDGYRRHGITIFWLDACEPEILPMEPDHWRIHAGSMLEVGNLYP